VDAQLGEIGARALAQPADRRGRDRDRIELGILVLDARLGARAGRRVPRPVR